MAEEAKDKPKLKLDKQLEDEVKRMGDYPLHPLISKISQRLGAFNLVRNARNQKQVDIEDAMK
jgi:hypothetical protein